jgi:uncharacterized delta-60 repeat protein
MKKIFRCIIFLLASTGFLFADKTPTSSRIYGTPYKPDVNLYQNLGQVGTLDQNFGTAGSLSLALDLPSYQIVALQFYDNGSYVVLADNGTNSKVAKYTARGVLDTAFGSGTGMYTLSSMTQYPSTFTTGQSPLIIDEQQRILVCGSSSPTSSWMKRLNFNGTLDTTFSWTDGLASFDYLFTIYLQSSGKIIAVGQDNSGYAQIARYHQDGSIDTTFGASGYVKFNGTQISGLSSQNQVWHASCVDSSNNIFVFYQDDTTPKLAKFTEDGALATDFDGASAGNGIITVSGGQILPSRTRLAIASNGDIIVGAQLFTGSTFYVKSFHPTTGLAGSYADFASTTINLNAREVRGLLAISNDKILVIGSNASTRKMAVYCLTTSGLDTSFNSVGYKEFSIGSPSTSSQLYGAALAPDGRLFVGGHQVNSGTTTPYVSVLHNTPYVSSIAKYPATIEQGTLDESFGDDQTYRGVVYPFKGYYGSSLQQKSKAVIELASENILIGMDGKLDNSNNSNLIFAELSADGDIIHKTALQKHQTNEYLHAMIEDADENIYVSGYSTAGIILRQYDHEGTQQWVADFSSSGHEGLSIGLQGTQRLILGSKVSSTAGKITGHLLSDGSLDSNFGTAGVIATGDFSLNMGPVYGMVINPAGNIFVAYKNSSTSAIDIAAIYADGSGLITQFGTAGVVSNVFSSTSFAVDALRLALDQNDNILIAVTTGTGFKLGRFDAETGNADTDFNSGSILTVASVGTSISLKQLVGLTDGSILLVGYDDLTDDQMILTKVTSTGSLDTQFNSQGTTPGIFTYQIANTTTNYYARRLQNIAVLSSSGNIVGVGYEQKLSTDATPVAFKVFGQDGVLQVKNSPTVDQIPGTLDASFDNNGAINLTSLIAAGSAKVVYAYRTGNTYEGKLLVAIDASGSTTVKIARVDAANMTLDSSFGTGGILTLSSLSGLNNLSLDAHDNIIACGTYSGAGWIKRITPVGVVDTTFTVPADIVAVHAVEQQKSGRYIAATNDSSGNGVLVAFQDSATGPLAVDLTFNILNGTQGRRNVSTTGLYNLVINNDDTLLVACSISSLVKVLKVKADGSNLDTNFGISGTLNTTMIPYNNTDIRVVKDSNDKVCVASAISGGTSVKICRYSASGAVDATFVGGIRTISNLGASVRLTHLMATNENSGQDKLIILGNNSSGANGTMFACRLAGNGSLDSTWNSDYTGSDSVGVTTFDIESAATMYKGSISINGSIYTTATNGGATSPLLIKLFGDNYITETEQAPLAADEGTLDTTLAQADNLVINSISGLSDLASSTPTLFHILSDNSYFMMAYEGTSSYVARLNGIYELESTFNAGDLLTIADATTITGFTFDRLSAQDDVDQSFYVSGTHSGFSWVKHYSSTGEENSNFVFVPHDDMTASYGIVQQSSGRIVLCGTDGTHGILTGHAIDGSVDEYGDHGKCVIPNSSVIYAMVADDINQSIVAFKYGSYVNLNRVYVSGFIDETFDVADADRISGVSANDQIKIILDNNGDVVVAAATSTGYKVRRYFAQDGSLDTGFGTAGELSFAFSGSAGTPKISDLIVDSTGRILVLGYNNTAGDKRFVVARLTDEGDLDTTFNADGSTPGIYESSSSSQNLDYVAFGLHEDRRILVYGSNSSNGDILLGRLFGGQNDYVTEVARLQVAQVPGELDEEFGTSGAFDMSDLAGIGNDQPKIVRTTSGGRVLVAVDTGSETLLVALGGQTTLDPDFDGAGISTTSCPSGVTDMFIDHNEKILVCGTYDGESWLARFNADGSIDDTFGSEGFVTNNFVAAYKILEQSNGRIFLSGLRYNYGTQGMLAAYTPSGALDLSFGTNEGEGGTGSMGFADEAIYSFIIDEDDRPIIVYYNGSDVTISCVTPNGSGLDETFGTAGSIVDALNTTITETSQARIGVDPDGNILVVGATATTIKLARYSDAGVLDTGFQSSGYKVLSHADFVLQDFIISQDALLAEGDESANDGNLIIVGYQNTVDDTMFVIWLTHAGALSTEFNPDTNVAGGPGYVAFEVTGEYSVRKLHSGALLKNGKLLLAGYENSGSADVPLLVQFYGQLYTDQQSQISAVAVPGTFDTTLNLIGIDSFNFGASATTQQYPQAVCPLDNGMYVVAGYGTTASDGMYNHFLITQFDAGGNLDENFGVSGVVEEPLLTSGVSEYVYDMKVDNNGRLVVIGYQDATDDVGLIRRYSAQGELDLSFGDLAGDPLEPTGIVSTLATKLYAVGFQSNGRIVAVGQDNTSLNRGVVHVYTQDGVIDNEFGLNGQWFIDDASEVHAVSIDVDDFIYIAYKHSTTGAATVAKIHPNGNEYDLSFGDDGKVYDVLGATIASSANIRLLVDVDNKIFVAASVNGANTVKAQRLDSSGAVDATFNGGSVRTIISGNAADRTMLHRVVSNNSGYYTLVGYQNVALTTSDKFWIAQIKNNGALDTLFNPDSSSQAGENLFTFNVAGSLQKLQGAAISNEGKIVVVGQEVVSTYATPVVAVFYNTQYSDEVEPSPSIYDDGEFDPSFNLDGIATFYADGQTSSAANQKSRAVRVLSNGKSMFVIGDGVDAWTMLVDMQGNPDEDYGVDGVLITKLSGNETINRMEIDGKGRMLIIGTNSTQGGFIKRLNEDGSLDTTFNPSGTLPGAIYGIMTIPYAVVELTTGQILVTGINSGVGTAKMYTSVGAVDTTFNSNGTYTNGASITSAAVTNENLIYLAVGYLDSSVKYVRVVAMDATAALVDTFGVNGVLDAAISNIDNYAYIRIALSHEIGIVLAASWTDGSYGKIAICRYDELGAPLDGFNNEEQFDVSFNKPVVLQELISLKDGKVLVGGYQDGQDTITNNDYSVIARVTLDGSLDLDFNSTGKLLIQIDPALQELRRLTSMDIQQDGRIVAALNESAATNTMIPYGVRIYGGDNLREVILFPGAGKSGTADINFGRFQDGIVRMYFGTNVDLDQYGKGLSIASNGQIYLFAHGYTDSDRTYQHYLYGCLLNSGYLNTTLGGSLNGAIPGVTITSTISTDSEIMHKVLKDSFGRTFTVGYVDSSTTQGLVRCYKPNGKLDTTFGGRNGAVHPTIEKFYAVGIQALEGKVIVGGTQYNNGTGSYEGVITRYKQTGQIDSQFGTSGNYTFDDSESIQSLVIGSSNDVIYVARNVDSDLVVSALDPNGGGLWNAFASSGEFTAWSDVTADDMIAISVDSSGNIIVASTIEDGLHSRVKIMRYSPTGVADSGFNGGSPLMIFTGTQNDRTNVVTKVVPLTNGKLFVVGYQDITATDLDNMFVAAIAANGSGYDTTFNPDGDVAGLYTLTVFQTGENSQFTDAQVQSDGKLVCIGHESPSFGGTSTIVARIHGFDTVPSVAQVPSYLNQNQPIATGQSQGGGVAPSLANTVSAATQGAAAHQFTGGSFANGQYRKAEFMVAGALQQNQAIMKNSHSFASSYVKNAHARWNHRS